MKQLDVFLSRLSFWLPAKQRKSILEEIRGVLVDRIAHAASMFGRPLSDQEIAETIDSFGKPVLIAARYVQGRPVVSGLLSFFYWRVLAVALGADLIVQTIVIATHMLRELQLQRDYWPQVTQHLVIAMLLTYSVVTICFVLLDRGIARREDTGG